MYILQLELSSKVKSASTINSDKSNKTIYERYIYMNVVKQLTEVIGAHGLIPPINSKGVENLCEYIPNAIEHFRNSGDKEKKEQFKSDFNVLKKKLQTVKDDPKGKELKLSSKVDRKVMIITQFENKEESILPYIYLNLIGQIGMLSAQQAKVKNSPYRFLQTGHYTRGTTTKVDKNYPLDNMWLLGRGNEGAITTPHKLNAFSGCRLCASFNEKVLSPTVLVEILCLPEKAPHTEKFDKFARWDKNDLAESPETFEYLKSERKKTFEAAIGIRERLDASQEREDNDKLLDIDTWEVSEGRERASEGGDGGGSGGKPKRDEFNWYSGLLERNEEVKNTLQGALQKESDPDDVHETIQEVIRTLSKPLDRTEGMVRVLKKFKDEFRNGEFNNYEEESEVSLKDLRDAFPQLRRKKSVFRNTSSLRDHLKTCHEMKQHTICAIKLPEGVVNHAAKTLSLHDFEEDLDYLESEEQRDKFFKLVKEYVNHSDDVSHGDLWCNFVDMNETKFIEEMNEKEIPYLIVMVKPENPSCLLKVEDEEEDEEEEDLD